MSRDLLQTIAQRTQLAGHNRLALLLFRLGERQLFGINVFKVQEVLHCPELSWVPQAHPLILGLADIRGRNIPVIDLAKALQHEPLVTEESYVVVTEFNRTVQGFLVHAVDRIVNISVEDIHPPPQVTGDKSYMTAITRLNDELIEIIDVEHVLADVVGQPQSVSASLLEHKPKAWADGQKPHVLVADDSRTARNQINNVLKQLGVDATLVADGRAALNFLKSMASTGEPVSNRVAMVISDIEMPDMDGYTLTTEIRRDPQLADLYVLLHTSLSGIFNNAMVARVGANAFVPKYSPDELARVVLDVLNNRAAA
ncbi:MAG: chemotaxis protein [Nevskiales bacterium]